MTTKRNELDTIQLWHGSHRWDPPPEIRAPKAGHAEHGAGIYATTHLMTASKYAKGGGAIVELNIRSNLNFLENAKIEAQELYDVAKSIPRLKKRENILRDIEMCANNSRDGKTIGLNVIVNLAVNHNAMIGQPALEISRFLVSKGVDASLYSRTNNEDWLVIYNTDAIVKSKKRPSSEISVNDYNRMPIKAQIQRCFDWRIEQAQLAQNELSTLLKKNTPFI